MTIGAALSEDPDIIKEWFGRVKDTPLEFGIVEDDIYNFDETGFMMGVMTSYKAVTDARSKKRPKSIFSLEIDSGPLP
jgi:RecB family endonuclease NucS